MTNTIANRIFLIGMMASGKSTIGKILAERLEYDFIDMDNIIEKENNMTIAKIFEIHGEDHFRILEHNLLSRLSNQQNVIISTGGGTPIFHQGINVMLNSGIVIWFKVSKDEIHKRLSESRHRPLGNRISKYALSNLIRNRNPIYKQADIKIWNKGNAEKVIVKILKAIAAKQKENN